VPENQLPVRLPPDVKNYLPKGQSPLAAVPDFVRTKCPVCGGEARRETDTMDTFVCSSWYFLRYLDPANQEQFCRKENAARWLPIDKYIGGITHATGHLIYFRFFTKVLYDAGLISVDEPAQGLFTQGMVLKGGSAMSKSKGNVIALGPFVETYGSDTARLVVLFAAPPEKSMEWSDDGVPGAQRFLNRVYRLVSDNAGLLRNVDFSAAPVPAGDERALYVKVNQTVKKVTSDIEEFKFNTALAALMELLNELNKAAPKKSPVFLYGTRCMVHLLSPLAPFLADEAWSMIGGKGSLMEEPWIGYDQNGLTLDLQTVVIQVNGRVRSKLEVPATITEAQIKELALKDEKTMAHVKGKTVKKIVYVPTRLVSIATD
jgi:leucyl-tRNA synthetase